MGWDGVAWDGVAWGWIKWGGEGEVEGRDKYDGQRMGWGRGRGAGGAGAYTKEIVTSRLSRESADEGLL